jgi:hypothetical protein
VPARTADKMTRDTLLRRAVSLRPVSIFGYARPLGLGVEAAIGRGSLGSDVILVPGEDSSTGNVTGGRKLARYVFLIPRLVDDCEAALSNSEIRGASSRGSMTAISNVSQRLQTIRYVSKPHRSKLDVRLLPKTRSEPHLGHHHPSRADIVCIFWLRR